MLIAKRLLSLVLVLVGVAVAVVGGWFTNRIGTDGTASFTLQPTSNAPILLEPSLLNRLTTEAVVTVTPAAGRELWVGTGGLADTRAAVGTAELVRAEGVDLREGTITTTTTGAGPAKALTSADVWRRVERGTGTPVTWRIVQSQSPDSLLVVSAQPVEEITVSWTRKSWFFQALVLTLLGVILVVSGLLVLRGTFRSRRAAVAAARAEEPTTTEVTR